MRINIEAVKYYSRPDVKYHGSHDKEFFTNIFLKYYAITGEKDSETLKNTEFIKDILDSEEGRPLLYLKFRLEYISESVRIAEDMTRLYEEIKPK